MKFLFNLFLFLAITASVFAQKSNQPTIKCAFNGKSCDPLVARLVDPKDFKSVNLAGISAADMSKTNARKPTGMDITLKESAKVMDLKGFFETYKVPLKNQGIIKVNGAILQTKVNFLASSTVIKKVDFGNDKSGNSFTNILTK